ncbi:hypothetical protein NA57DRAFT_72813 [Rhizodiscina lignyota]|uniref:Zn(2)-C6 fungal-type domain-containing protein n=1 Tax=Rhizodiscina lignyota TaxID=1504668 RepID=A0A9P4IHW5_9PEZI|nr:hypothetical protein NA57DRAFT_72813 [Rhizodiscina lignyota]
MNAPPTKRRPPRLNHKKSKTGCLRCKQRRVKCDEKHPVCGGCERHEVPCVFANTAQDGPMSFRTQSTASISNGRDDAFHINHLEPAESRGRRLEELKLLHTWTTATTLTLPGADQAIVRDSWAVSVVPLALEHPPLLYAILSLSAFHLSILEPHNAAKHTTTARRYLVLSLRHHNAAISVLNAANADPVCLTCILISVLTFRNLGTSYVPETSITAGSYRNSMDHTPFSSLPQRLMISHGAGQTFREAWSWIKDCTRSKSTVIIKAAPQYLDTPLYPSIPTANGHLPYPRDFADASAYLLGPDAAVHGIVETSFNDPGPMVEELWDRDIRGAYEEALAHIGVIHGAIEAREPPLTICRRLMGFPAMLPQRFIDLVQEGRPRAMVILAHFFAAAKAVEDVWWVGDAGRLEVRAIWESLPERWKRTMGLPMRVVHEGQR